MRVLFDLLIGEEFFCFFTDIRCMNLHALPQSVLQYLENLFVPVGLYCMSLFIYYHSTTFSFNSIPLLPRELVPALHISSSVW